jgi:asparagine synthase (glutamine-hydrolysing)
MTGLVGGTIDGSELEAAVDSLSGRSHEKAWHFEQGGRGLGLTSTTGDPASSTVWNDGARGGAIYGAVTNLDEIGWTNDELFERLLKRPAETAAAIEGDFFAACYDGGDDRFVLATDKLGSRSCFYTGNAGFHFATGVNVLVSRIDDPSLDVQAASDMLLMGHMWGDRTLVEEVRAMRPATVLEVTDGTASTTRYWKPDYTAHEGGPAYLNELANRYDQAARRVAGTLPETAGIWLSGGLDSRMTAAVLLRHTRSDGFRTLRAYGYDANPPTNDNPKIASAVAESLGIRYEQVSLSPETFAEDFERAIEVVDGMLQWSTTANLSPSYRITAETPVLMEGMEGALIGDHLLRHHFDKSRSIVDAQQQSEASTSVSTVEQLLEPDVDPLGSFKTEAERTPESTHHGKVLDIHFQNYHARLGLASNRLMRDRGGCRTVQVDGDYLEWCAKLPHQYRKGTFPLSERVVQADAGGIPYGTSPAKLELCRRISPELAGITYERTKLKPSLPYPVHAAGFVGNVLVNKIRQKPTYASGQLQDFWIRDTGTYLHQRVANLIGDAGDRDLFAEDAVKNLFEEHMTGANNASMLAKITTLEYWIQEHLD